MYLFGTALMVAALALALLAGVSSIFVVRGNRAALSISRASVYGSAAMVTGIWLLLTTLFLLHRFDIDYVNNYSSTDLSLFFTVAAVWAGQPGSFALWILFNGIIALFLVKQAQHFEPYILISLMFIQVALLGLLIISSPFSPTVDPSTGALLSPPDGKGLNPLLHNFWMIIHPPILFLGYALAAVPFAFALGGLLRYDYDNWVARALPWTLAAWVALGLALLLGGYWSYETLGWGGYWGWDPVENSSLVPWLTLTALIHGMLVQRTHGSLRRSNFILAILTFLFIFYATYLTRSGVLANFSVHSFLAEGLSGAMTALLLLIGLTSFSLLILRWRDIPSRPLSDKFFSRDSFFVLAILSLLILSFVIILGTSMPVISAIPKVGSWLQKTLSVAFELDNGSAMGGEPLKDGRFSLTSSFYQRVTPPLAVILLLLMIIGPLLGWRGFNPRNLLKTLAWPAGITVAVTCIALVLGVRHGLALICIAFSMFAIGTNLVMLIRILRSGWLRGGGYLAHVGIALMLIGIVGSSVYATPDERIVLSPGDSAKMYGYNFTFNGWKEASNGRGEFDLTVQRENERFSVKPQIYFNDKMGSTMQTPAVKSYLWQDLYISPADYIPESDPSQPVLGMGDKATIGPYEVTFQEFVIDQEAMLKDNTADVGAKLKVVYQGAESSLVPRIRLKASMETTDVHKNTTFEDLPVQFPGGHTVSLKTFDPQRRLILLNAQGLNLPKQPARAVITVSLKPAVILVWLGISLSLFGGLIALLRRFFEGQARLRGQIAHLPRSFGALWSILRKEWATS